jgi:hypothetical protein
MNLHLFKCSSKKLRTAITNDQTGNNLPIDRCENGNWEYWKSINVNPNDPTRIGAPSSDEILKAIASNGYLISDSEIKFEERTE